MAEIKEGAKVTGASPQIVDNVEQLKMRLEELKKLKGSFLLIVKKKWIKFSWQHLLKQQKIEFHWQDMLLKKQRWG